MSEIVLTLPEKLAREAEDNGLLNPEFIASLLRAEIRRRRVNRLFAAADRLADLDEPLTEAEIEAEIKAARRLKNENRSWYEYCRFRFAVARATASYSRCRPRGIIELFTSPVLLEELEDVLSRQKFVKRLEAAQVTVRELVEGYSALANVIDAAPIEPVILSDPDDDAVLACALAADAEIIVSGDSDLLDLKEHQDIRILTATEFLSEISL